MCWHPHHKQWILYVQNQGRTSKNSTVEKIFLGSLRWVSTQRDSTKSNMAAKKKKKYFLLDYKFIKYTLHRFLLPLACKTGRPVPAVGGWGFVSYEGLRAHRSTGHDCARACRCTEARRPQYMNKSTSQTWDYLTKTPATWKSLKSLKA